MSSRTAATFMIDQLVGAGAGTMSTAAGNQEAVAAWDGVLFDRYAAFRHLILPGLGAHGNRALELYPPRAGERVLDIGCGFGDTTQQIAKLVGPDGDVVGVDASPRFVRSATAEAQNAGITNARFVIADVEGDRLEDGFDAAFSRMGTMFFANPVAALRNVRQALVPGGRLCMVVWRQKPDNGWLHQAELAVEKLVGRRTDYGEPTCGPGPFSMADADTTSGILVSAGYEDISLTRSDIPMLIGRDLQEATDCVMALGPAGEIIRLAGEDAERIKPRIVGAVRRVLEQFDGPDGVRAHMSTWIVSARTPRQLATGHRSAQTALRESALARH